MRVRVLVRFTVIFFSVVIFLSLWGVAWAQNTAQPQCPVNASFSSFSGLCECNLGYKFDGEMCISLEGLCTEEYGVGAESTINGCKCKDNYMLATGKCVEGVSFCNSRFGAKAYFDNESRGCKCSEGYFLNTSRSACINAQTSCVEQFGSNAQGAGGASCKCKEGYVWNDNRTACVNPVKYCLEKFGENSYYDEPRGACYCDEGFVMDKKTNTCTEALRIPGDDSSNGFVISGLSQDDSDAGNQGVDGEATKSGEAVGQQKSFFGKLLDFVKGLFG